MRDPYDGTFERRRIFIDQNATQTLQYVLPDCLPSLYRRAFRLLRNAADAEDAVQDTLLAAYTHMDQFRGRSQMSTWLSAIVHNCARMQSELSRRLYHCQTELSPTLRLTFQLREVQGLSIRETARILGVPHGTVKTQSARARKKLRELIRRGVRPRSPYPSALSTHYSGARGGRPQ
jgi:DNA-directed RNA polymerase specialized sigma24 family protein